MSDSKLQMWQAAGLIDAPTAARIAEFEAARARPMGIWALVAVGALAIGLGLVSLIAANWDAIPGGVRIAVHFVAMAGFAIWLALRWRGWGEGVAPPRAASGGTVGDTSSADTGWGAIYNDALLFILAALGLTFFGHIGQVYQTSSPLWQPLLVWLILFSPLLLGFGRGWLAALTWMAGMMGTANSLLGWLAATDGEPPAIVAGLVASLPAVTLAIGAVMRGTRGRDEFFRRVEQVSMALVVTHACWLLILPAVGALLGSSDGDNNLLVISFLFALFCAIAAVAVYLTRRRAGGVARAVVLIACGLCAILAAMIGDAGSLMHGIIFMALWAAIAWAALHAEWRGVFQIAIAVLSLRLIILSFELATDLLGSGVGLILAGLCTLGIAYGAVRVSRRFAPDKHGPEVRAGAAS